MFPTPVTSSGSSNGEFQLPQHRTAPKKVDDVMRTIADWKSKTQLNDDNQENNLRSGVAAGSYGLTNLNRLASGSNGTLFQNTVNSGPSSRLFSDDGDSGFKADRYREIVKDLKKKYTRSRTEVT
jgi:hypothetical protein